MEIKEYQKKICKEKRQYESYSIKEKHKGSNLIPLIILKQHGC